MKLTVTGHVKDVLQKPLSPSFPTRREKIIVSRSPTKKYSNFLRRKDKRGHNLDIQMNNASTDLQSSMVRCSKNSPDLNQSI